MTEAKLIGGRYRPVQKVGRGPLGETFAVEDTQLARPAVLEVLQGPPLAGPEAKLPPAALLGLKGDLEKLARIRDPHLIILLDLQFAAKPPFLVYEPVSGEPLPKACPPGRLKGPALEEKLEKLARDLLDGLDALHKAGVVHKDLRPATVLATAAGEHVLMEPGLALDPAGLAALHPSVLAQVLPWQAPEALAAKAGAAPGPAADLWQLGALLRFVAGGKPPYPSPDKAREAAAKGARLPPLEKELPALRKAWCQFVDELMDPQVGKRIASVAAAREFLDLMLLEEAAGAAPAGPALPPPPANPRSMAAVALPAVLVAAAGAAWLVLGAGTPPRLLAGTLTPGLAKLDARWAPTDGAPAAGTVTLRIEDAAEAGGELAPEAGAYQARLDWAKVSARLYKVVDAKGAVLASGQFPEAGAPFKGTVAFRFPEAGGAELLVEANREITVAAFARGPSGEARLAASEKPARTHVLPLAPKPDETIEDLRLEAKAANGETAKIEAPTQVQGSKAFLQRVPAEARTLVPAPVAAAIKDALGKAQDQALQVDLPGWRDVRAAWDERPFWIRLRRQGPALFKDPASLGDELLLDAYLGLQELERANTAITALTREAPLPTREVYAPLVRALEPATTVGELAMQPKQGAVMMQFDGAPPSFLNEDGRKKWPSRFETDYEVPEAAWKTGRIRFTVAVDDVSPLYRMELAVNPQAGGEGPERAFWLYPRRNMMDVAQPPEGSDKTARMAVEVPTALLPGRKLNLRLTVDRLGAWGGHGGTTFAGLWVGAAPPPDPPKPAAEP